MTIGDIIAQIPAAQWWTPLISGGSTGAVLGAIVVWFATRAEKILEKLRTAMERNTNALMISVLHTRHLDDAIKPLAQKLADESDAALKGNQ